MTDPLETLRWHEQDSESRQVEPLNLTDKEMLDWLDEYADGVTQTAATDRTLRVVTIISDVIPPTKGTTWREAVKLAAAKFKAANE